MATTDARAFGGFGGIQLSFNEKKAAAAAGVLLKQVGGRMPYMRLIKLLYLADRESLDRTGRPIIGGRYVAMKYGPVLSEVLDLVKDEGGSLWSEFIQTDRFDVVLAGEPDLGPLSQVEIDLLQEAAQLCEKLDQWKLADLTHTFPEWKDPGTGAFDIAPEEIFRALGKTDEEIEEARQTANERAHFDSLFGR